MIFKKNNGYVGIDVSIALIIMMIAIPTIIGIIYNVNRAKSNTVKKTEATSIAVNTIEAIKGIGINNINDATSNDEIDENIYLQFKEIYTDAELSNDEKSIILTKDEITYQIKIEITDYANTPSGQNITADDGLVKIIKVRVEYKEGNKIQNVEINTPIS